MTFTEIEAARKRAGISCRDLSLRAGVHPYVYYRARTGRTIPRVQTIERWDRALRGSSSFRAPAKADHSELISSVFRGWAVHFASLLGQDPEVVLASDPKLRASSSPEWLAAARVRELAVYCTVTELDLPGARVARAIGMTRAAVSLMLRRVEDNRSDPTVDAMIEAAGRLISGRAH